MASSQHLIQTYCAHSGTLKRMNQLVVKNGCSKRHWTIHSKYFNHYSSNYFGALSDYADSGITMLDD